MEDLKDHVRKRRATIRPPHLKYNIHYGKKLGITHKEKSRHYATRPLLLQKIIIPGHLYTLPINLIRSWHKKIIGFATLVFLLWMLSGIIWLYPSFLRQSSIQIHLQGHTTLTPANVYQIAGIDSHLEFHQIDAYQMVSQLNQHPLIKQALVRKLFPDTIFIFIKERRPYAYLKAEDAYYLIDEQLHPIQIVSTSLPQPSFALTGIEKDAIHLGQPIVSAGLEQGRELLNLMRESALPWDQFAELDVADPLNLKLKLRDPPLLVQLGHKNYLEKIRTFEKIYSQLQQSGKPLSSIDLRYQNKAIVRF